MTSQYVEYIFWALEAAANLHKPRQMDSTRLRKGQARERETENTEQESGTYVRRCPTQWGLRTLMSNMRQKMWYTQIFIEIEDFFQFFSHFFLKWT